MDRKDRNKGIAAAIASAIFLGLAPVFGKQAILFGFSPLALVTFRTGLATIILFLAMLIFQRQFLYIYPLGLAGCLLAGFINGIASIFYYDSLRVLNASVGQVLYSFYPMFTAFWLLLDRHPIQRLTIIRLVISLPGVYLLLQTGSQPVDLIGAGMMLFSAILYALHLIINQRILYEVPAPTVTFYTMTAMTVTVSIPYLFSNPTIPPSGTPWWPVLGMAGIMLLSRIALFIGIKRLGGLQTAMLGLGELLVTVFVAHWWLNETFTLLQWVGALLLGLSLLLVGFEKLPPQKRHTTGLLAWLNPPKINPSDTRWSK